MVYIINALIIFPGVVTIAYHIVDLVSAPYTSLGPRVRTNRCSLLTLMTRMPLSMIRPHIRRSMCFAARCPSAGLQ